MEMLVKAGADSVEHSTYLDADVDKLLIENGVYVVPTFLPYMNYALLGEQEHQLMDTVLAARAIVDEKKRRFKEAFDLGVKVAFGRDSGGFMMDQGEFVQEMLYMEDAGMTPAQIIHAATEESAKLCGVFGETGSIDEGKSADMILLSASPLEDLRAFNTALLGVYMRGRYLGKREGGGLMSSFLAYTVNGLVLGSTYALTAIGYSMVYGILELVNFTHSTIYMVGAYLFYILVSIAKLPLWLGFLLSVVLTGLIGVSYEWLTLRPLRERKQPKFAMLICTIGTSIVLQNTFFLLMGSETRQFPTIFEGKSIEIMGFNITMAQVFIIISTVVLLIAFTLFINKTRIGMAMRSCSQDTEAAELMGINVNHVVSFTFFLGSALAAVAA